MTNKHSIFEAVTSALAGPRLDPNALAVLTGAKYAAIGLALAGPLVELQEICTPLAWRWATAFAGLQPGFTPPLPARST
jgi:hypothetical protein